MGNILEDSRENHLFKRVSPSLKGYEGALCQKLYWTVIVPLLVKNPFTFGNVLGVSSPFLSEKESSSLLHFSSCCNPSSSGFLFIEAHVCSCVLMVFCWSVFYEMCLWQQCSFLNKYVIISEIFSCSLAIFGVHLFVKLFVNWINSILCLEMLI